MHEEHANEDRPARFITFREQVSDLYGIAPAITVTHTIAVSEITSLKTYDGGDYGWLTFKNGSVIKVDEGAAAVRLQLLGVTSGEAPTK